MPKIRLDLDRLESYALLVMTETIRRRFFANDEGIPFIAAMWTETENREYTQVNYLFEASQSDWRAEVQVNAGDIWPKSGNVLLTRVAIAPAGSRLTFRLTGNPDCPRFEITSVVGDV